VRLLTTVIVPQLHDPVMLAKGLATGDVLSGGRLTVGVGVGGRHEDYHAVGADPATQTMRGLAERPRPSAAPRPGPTGWPAPHWT
jgi:alkanesulfonate monooxygenase SsuD/methylene tetrahydromethanopterin reductase-like flavin-dependent oxidoreductase (luciferase family)